MPTMLNRSAEITVGLPPDQAIALFTAEGERRWADGWDPRYPEPERRDGPGVVFDTTHGSHQTTWIMVDDRPDGVRYARITHGMTAGTVAVDVVTSDNDTTRVRVTYDLTALTPTGEAWLADLDAHYGSKIASWATHIATALTVS
jgi:hypothetical protein